MWWWVAAASAATTVDRTLDAPGEPTVSVSAPCGVVRVNGSDRATVRVTGTIEGKSLDMSADAGQVTVDANSNDKCVDLTLEVPAAACLELEGVATSFTVDKMRCDVEVETVSGTVTITGSARAVHAETISGSLRMTGAAQRVELESVSGNVVAEGVGGTVRLESVSGWLELIGGSPLTESRLETVSGNITIRGALAPDGRLEATTHSGNLKLSLPGDTSARLSQSTFSGHVRNAFGADRDLVLGAGKGRIELSSFSGDVDVERR